MFEIFSNEERSIV